MNFLIREGKVGDLTSVLELVNELAEIRDINNVVFIDIYDLVGDGFSLNPLFKLFVAEIKDKIVGFALYYMSYSTSGKSLIIEDVYVARAHKKSGIGISLFAKCLDYAKKENIQRIEWRILEKEKSLIELYKQAGAKILNDTCILEIFREEIIKNADVKFKLIKPIKYKKIIIRFGEINDMASVLDLIKELVVYKKDTCDITVYDLMKDGFSKSPLFKTVILEVENKVVGVLMFHVAYSPFHGKSLIIEDLIIKKEYRGLGLGRALNIKLLKYAKLNKIQKIQQAIFIHDKAAIDRCLVFGAQKAKGLRIVQISYKALSKFINK